MAKRKVQQTVQLLYLPVALATSLMFVFVAASNAKETIQVGGFSFPPFVEFADGETTGLTLELIDLVNQSQSEFEFVFVRTSPKRRYQDMKDGRFQAMFFENAAWGWDGKPVKQTEEFLTGGEVYITKKTEGRGQEYFDDLSGKSKLGILGYHYGFANFDSSKEGLAKHNARATSTHSGNIQSVLLDRADIAVVTYSYIQRFMDENPDEAAKLLVSEKLDQPYSHRILVGNNSPASVEWFDQLLSTMSAGEDLRTLFASYGFQAVVG